MGDGGGSSGGIFNISPGYIKSSFAKRLPVVDEIVDLPASKLMLAWYISSTLSLVVKFGIGYLRAMPYKVSPLITV